MPKGNERNWLIQQEKCSVYEINFTTKHGIGPITPGKVALLIYAKFCVVEYTATQYILRTTRNILLTSRKILRIVRQYFADITKETVWLRR